MAYGNPFYTAPSGSWNSYYAYQARQKAQQQAGGGGPTFNQAMGAGLGTLVGVKAAQHVSGYVSPYLEKALNGIGDTLKEGISTVFGGPTTETAVATQLPNSIGQQVAGQSFADGSQVGGMSLMPPEQGGNSISDALGSAMPGIQTAAGAYGLYKGAPATMDAIKAGNVGGAALNGGLTGMSLASTGMGLTGLATGETVTGLAGMSSLATLGAAAGIGAIAAAGLAYGQHQRWGKGHESLKSKRQKAVRGRMQTLGLLDEGSNISFGDGGGYFAGKHGEQHKNFGNEDFSPMGDFANDLERGTRGTETYDWTNPTTHYAIGMLSPLNVFATGTTENDMDQFAGALYSNALQDKYGNDIYKMRDAIKGVYQNDLGLSSVGDAYAALQEIHDAGGMTDQQLLDRQVQLNFAYGEDMNGNHYDAVGAMTPGSRDYEDWVNRQDAFKKQGITPTHEIFAGIANGDTTALKASLEQHRSAIAETAPVSSEGTQ